MRTSTVLVMALMMALVGLRCTPSTHEVLLRYQRTGGVAGINDQLIITADGNARITRMGQQSVVALDADTMAAIHALFTETGFMQQYPSVPPVVSGADRIEYLVMYRGHTVRVMDGAIPAGLDPVIAALDAIIETGDLHDWRQYVVPNGAP